MPSSSDPSGPASDLTGAASDPSGSEPSGEAAGPPGPAGGLGGRVAVLTGAGSGIGRAALDAYLAAGARVVALERSPEKCAELRALGDDVAVVEGDATRAADHGTAVAEARRRFGRIDVAAAFVGVFDTYTALLDIPDADFDAAFEEVFSVNVKSALLLARAAGPALREAQGTLILTLSSSSFYAGRGGTLYVASKFALRGVVVQLAHELAPDVRVNGVAPGGTVGTDLRGLSSLGRSADRLDDRPGRREQLEARTPMHVALTPADHAGLYVFLASAAARHLTGEILRSDGGLGVR